MCNWSLFIRFWDRRIWAVDTKVWSLIALNQADEREGVTKASVFLFWTGNLVSPHIVSCYLESSSGSELYLTNWLCQIATQSPSPLAAEAPVFSTNAIIWHKALYIFVLLFLLLPKPWLFAKWTPLAVAVFPVWNSPRLLSGMKQTGHPNIEGSEDVQRLTSGHSNVPFSV